MREGGPALAPGRTPADRILPRDACFTDLVSRHALPPGFALLVTIGMLVTGTGRWLARRIPALAERVRAVPALLPAGTATMVILLGLGLTVRSLATLAA